MMQAESIVAQPESTVLVNLVLQLIDFWHVTFASIEKHVSIQESELNVKSAIFINLNEVFFFWCKDHRK